MNYPKTATSAEAEAFFRNPHNFVKLNVDEIFQILGYPDEWADWDLGRIYAHWSDRRARVSIYTRSDGRVDAVELVWPRRFFWFGGSTELLWHAAPTPTPHRRKH